MDDTLWLGPPWSILPSRVFCTELQEIWQLQSRFSYPDTGSKGSFCLLVSAPISHNSQCLPSLPILETLVYPVFSSSFSYRFKSRYGIFNLFTFLLIVRKKWKKSPSMKNWLSILRFMLYFNLILFSESKWSSHLSPLTPLPNLWDKLIAWILYLWFALKNTQKHRDPYLGDFCLPRYLLPLSMSAWRPLTYLDMLCGQKNASDYKLFIYITSGKE